MSIGFSAGQQNKQIRQLKTREEESFVELMAGKIGHPYIDLQSIGIETDALKLIPEEKARSAQIASFKITGKDLLVGVRSSENIIAKEIITDLQKQGYNITVYLLSRRSLEKAWERYKDITMATQADSFLSISSETLEQLAQKIKINDDIKAEIERAMAEQGAHTISKILEVIFGGAIATGSSDVHIEPYEKNVRIRFRQDGVLQDIIEIAHATYKKINSRIKLLSELKISQTEEAQDGRFTIKYQDSNIEIRTSLVPSAYGEGIVMRILNPEATKVGFDKLGIEPKLFRVLENEIKKPTGMILTTGPTGSGKTTTLYSILRKIYNPEVKIMTIEDPIEYHLDGISQTQVEHERGYDFLAGLRAALRQDPDIIMVGEIRDTETAKIAVNAALTGHLVLSTLHTNNAAGAIPRLLDLGVNPKIMGSALSVALAQRLVRKLCPSCKKKTSPTPEQELILRGVLEYAHNTGKDLAAYNVTVDQPIEIYEAVGCEQCNGLGYKGRIGIFEAILNDANIEKLMKENPSEREITKVATSQGILTMPEDGVMKILSGVTSLSEIAKVVDLSIPDDIPIAPNQKEKSQPTEQPSQTNKDTGIENKKAQITLTPSTRSTEITLLVDYLKDLEQDQQLNPGRGIADKIKKIKNTIILLLENSPAEELFAQPSERDRVHTEVKNLMTDLEALEKHQMEKPSVGVADEIQNIRTMIQGIGK
ncbi:MAG: GspE/PulE family protein [Candidatus Nomurabacteria bacterium]|nr:GspE/PulE family protein [Candidatus Nomurabacteria bacterium]